MSFFLFPFLVINLFYLYPVNKERADDGPTLNAGWVAFHTRTPKEIYSFVVWGSGPQPPSGSAHADTDRLSKNLQ